MGKEEIFSKLNIKDYNNELEIIIEKKAFSENTKNLLLSMFYKIENSYDDYKKIKSIEKTKKEELEEVLNVIEKGCRSIAIIKPKLEENPILGDRRSIAIKKERKIIAYPNEKSLFYALCQLQKERYIVDTDLRILKDSLELLFNEGLYINNAEVIRDFDGWSWNTEKEEISNFIYNLIYQDILIILGEKNLREWLYGEKTFEKIANILGDKTYKTICKLALLEYIKDNEDKEKRIEEENNEFNKKLLEMSDKKKYLESIAQEKKQVERKIKEIDNIITNMKKLKEEFSKENSKLDEKSKVFSLSDFVEIKQNERIHCINQLKKCSESMNPSFYIEAKEKLKEKIDIFSIIQYKDKKDNLIIELQKEVIKNFEKKLNKIETKKEIYDMIYKLRYYKEIFIKEDIKIKDKKELIKNLKSIEKKLFTMACNFKVLNILSNDIEENYNLMAKILDTRIIDLEDIVIEFKKSNGKIIFNIYEDNILEKFIEYNEIKELNMKYNKKIKLFI